MDFKVAGTDEGVTALQMDIKIAGINEQILEEISRAGGGSFLRFNNQPANFKNIIKEVDVMEKRLIQSHMYSQYEDQFQKFGSLSLCLFIASIFISSRKRKK